MTISNFASASPASASTHDLAFPSNTVAGSTLVACIRTGTATTVTCALVSGSGFTARATSPVDNVGRDYYFTLENSPGGAQTVRFTLSAAGAPRILIAEITDALTASVDVAANNTGTGTALTSGATATTAQADEEAVAFFSASANETFAQNGSWLIIGVEPAAGSSRIALVHQRLTSTGTPNAAVDMNASTTWIGQQVTFRVAGGGAAAASFPNARPSLQHLLVR
jgi:hypothetical protein